MKSMLLVAGGGALGALARYGAYEFLRGHHWPLPWGTLLVNLAGALCIGYFLGAHLEQGRFSVESRLFFTVGFLGALTTFSTFSWESLRLLQSGLWGWLALHLLANNLGCLALAWAGWRLARQGP